MQTVMATEELGATVDQLGSLTLSDWLWAGGLLAGSIVLAVAMRRVLGSTLGRRTNPFVARLLARLVAGVVFILGVVYTMARLGVSIAPLLGALGLIGLALAFAFQDILENFIAGILMSLRRPFNEGDQIRTGDIEGTVLDITLRSVTLRAYNGERIYVPNAMVWKSPIVNHTEMGSRRTTLSVGVAYTTDLDAAQRIFLDAVAGVEGVLADPPPNAFVEEFGDSSINFAVRFWHEPQTAVEWVVRDQVARTLKRTMDAEGIEIPFPQRVLHIPRGAITFQTEPPA